MPSDPSDSWLEISVQVAGVDAELAADVLRQACPGGVAIQPAHRLDLQTDSYVIDGDAPAVVKGYLPAAEDAARLRRSLRLALKSAPLQSPPQWRRARLLRGECWRDSWKKQFGLQRLGSSLVVKPSWLTYKLKHGETVIEIDPGMAFGTGQHPTTAMCLRTIEDLIRPGTTVLDLGSGSGILAIAAARLRASRVLALDIDPLAVKATRENAAANAVAGVVEAREGTLDAAAGEAFDLLAANISGLTLERLAPGLLRALKPGGHLVASGFLQDAVGGLTRAFEEAGLRIAKVIDEGVWRAIIAAKP